MFISYETWEKQRNLTSCPIFFQELFATCWGRRVNIKRVKKGGRERERENICRWCSAFTGGWPTGCLCNTQVTESQENTLLLPNLAKNFSRRILHGWFRSCKKKANRRPLFFRPWWPFSHCLHFFFFWWRVLSSAIRSPSQEKRQENENKNKEMKRGKSEFSAMNILILKNKWHWK